MCLGVSLGLFFRAEVQTTSPSSCLSQYLAQSGQPIHPRPSGRVKRLEVRTGGEGCSVRSKKEAGRRERDTVRAHSTDTGARGADGRLRERTAENVGSPKGLGAAPRQREGQQGQLCRTVPSVLELLKLSSPKSLRLKGSGWSGERRPGR